MSTIEDTLTDSLVRKAVVLTERSLYIARVIMPNVNHDRRARIASSVSAVKNDYDDLKRSVGTCRWTDGGEHDELLRRLNRKTIDYCNEVTRLADLASYEMHMTNGKEVEL